MREIRLVGKNSDGSYLELIDEEGVAYSLPMSEALRSLVNQPRLVALHTFADQPITVREIQA